MNREVKGLDTKTQSDQEQIDISVKDLLDAGAHFGHQKRRWNPKMQRYIFESRDGIYIIDLAKTMQQIRAASSVVKKAISDHKSILFVGTKKQAKAVIKEFAEQTEEFYVCERWLGGMLTNLPTIRNSVKKLERIDKKVASGGEGLTKKELVNLTKLQVKLDKNLSGVRGLRKPPGLLVVVDPNREHLAVSEANKLGIPIIALVDTNCDPDPIEHVIACNDDALKSIKLIISTLAKAITEQKNKMNLNLLKEGKKVQDETDEASTAVKAENNEK
jgi:small subunit ribosomal protein S2